MTWLIVLASVAFMFRLTLAASQEIGAPLSLEQIIDLHRNEVPCKPIASRVAERGVNFDVTQDALTRLKTEGICELAIREIEKKGVELARKKKEEEERRKFVEERKRIEEERRRLEAEKKKADELAIISRHIKRATSYLEKGEYREAISEFEQARVVGPTNKELLANLEKAHKAWDAEKSLPSSEAFSLENIERLLTALTPKRVAALLGERGIVFEPSQPDMERLKRAGADDQLIVAIEKKGLENERKIGKSIEAAESYLDQGKYLEAIGEIDKSRAISPTSKKVLANLDRAYSAQNAEASLRPGPLGFTDLERLLRGRVTPKRVASLVSQRDVNFNALTGDGETKLRAAGANDEVIVGVKEKVFAKAPPVPGRRKTLGTEEVRLVNSGKEAIGQKKYEEAMGYFERALQTNPEYGEAWERKGDALRGLKRYAEAVQSYEKALEINSLDVDTWIKHGLVLQDLSRNEEAVRSFEKALDINPKNWRLWVLKGDSLRSIQRCGEARNSYDRALQINPAIHLTLEERYARLKDCR